MEIGEEVPEEGLAALETLMLQKYWDNLHAHVWFLSREPEEYIDQWLPCYYMSIHNCTPKPGCPGTFHSTQPLFNALS